LEGYLFAIGLVLISSLIYCGSLRLKPWVKCSKCDGQPRVKGWMFSYAHHTCPKCGGTGRQVRWGYRFFRMGLEGEPPE
jgi:DnaJ-class molecular chaperone